MGRAAIPSYSSVRVLVATRAKLPPIALRHTSPPLKSVDAAADHPAVRALRERDESAIEAGL